MTSLLARLLRLSLWLLMKSCRITIKGMEHLDPNDPRPKIIALWHEELVPLAEILYPHGQGREFVAFVSKSRDGKLLSAFIATYSPASVVEVPHNGRAIALKSMIEKIAREGKTGLITPDGPRGPRRKLKEGLRLLAKESGAHIVPFFWRGSAFSLSTWDRMRIPKPFSTIEVHFGPPLEYDDSHIEEALCGDLRS